MSLPQTPTSDCRPPSSFRSSLERPPASRSKQSLRSLSEETTRTLERFISQNSAGQAAPLRPALHSRSVSSHSFAFGFTDLNDSRSQLLDQGPRSCTVGTSAWPSTTDLRDMEKAELSGRNRSGCLGWFQRLSRRQKFMVQFFLLLLIIGLAVGLGVGISVAVGGKMKTASGQNVRITPPDAQN